MNTVKQFDQNGYVAIPELIPMDLCNIFSTYALLKEKEEFNPEVAVVVQEAMVDLVFVLFIGWNKIWKRNTL